MVNARFLLMSLFCSLLCVSFAEAESPISWSLYGEGRAVFDGNVAEDQSGQTMFYGMPALGGELEFFQDKTPLTLQADFTYNGFIENKDIDDIDPLMSFEADIELGKEDFTNTIAASYSFYGQEGFRVDKNDPANTNFTIGFREFEITNTIERDTENSRISFEVSGDFRDFNDSTNHDKNGKDGVDITVEPGIQKKFQIGTFFQIQAIDFSGAYRRRIVQVSTENTNRFKIAASMNGRLGIVRWDLETSFLNSKADGYDVSDYNSLAFKPEISIPITDFLLFGVKGEIERQFSDLNPKDNFRDNRAHAYIRVSLESKNK